MKLVYNIAIFFYRLIILAACPFQRKARMWVSGRKGLFSRLEKEFAHEKEIIWIHCSSLGEFEQGRPVIEAIKENDPGSRILLTFFSPSGYEVRKDYAVADYVCYLPFDFKRNVDRFLDMLDIRMALFVKYEFWMNYITGLSRRSIPLYSVSAIFRPNQLFFRWYGRPYRRMLSLFKQIFVQDQGSADLLSRFAISNVTITGDTRFDRVSAIAKKAESIGTVESFLEGREAVVAGSTWPADEKIISAYIQKDRSGLVWIIAPHEIEASNLTNLESLIDVPSIRYSKLPVDNPSEYRVLIIDNIGMLSALYQYGKIAYVGGGFGKGIHNILEPATFGMPVIFGPKHIKFREAVDLVNVGGAISINNHSEFSSIMNKLINDRSKLKQMSGYSHDFVNNSTGATQKLVNKILR